jgi:hypothetical protein
MLCSMSSINPLLKNTCSNHKCHTDKHKSQSAPLSEGPSQSESKRDEATTLAKATQINPILESTQNDPAHSEIKDVY